MIAGGTGKYVCTMYKQLQMLTQGSHSQGKVQGNLILFPKVGKFHFGQGNLEKSAKSQGILFLVVILYG